MYIFRSHLKTIVPQKFFVRLYRNFAIIAKQEFAYVSYVKKFMCKMAENLQADEVLRL